MNLFNRETELVNAFACNYELLLKSLSNRSKYSSFLVQEFDSNFGVADLVLGTFNQNIKKSQRREPINPNWIMPLANFKKGDEFSITDLCASHRFSKNGTKKRLNEYEQAGFLQKLSSNSFRVIKEYKPITDLVVSIEAKLKDWRRAIVQAQRYTRFSDFTFVLLDGDRVSSALANLEVFKALNVGLLSIKDNSLDFHYKPKRNQKKISEYYFRINEVAYGRYSKAYLQSDSK